MRAYIMLRVQRAREEARAYRCERDTRARLVIVDITLRERCVDMLMSGRRVICAYAWFRIRSIHIRTFAVIYFRSIVQRCRVLSPISPLLPRRYATITLR